MVEEGRDCREVVNQVVAVKAALSSLNAVLLTCFIRDCLDTPDCASEYAREKTVDDLVDMMLKATR
jgi:DNA-binding FrmR family transcriptional regulator